MVVADLSLSIHLLLLEVPLQMEHALRIRFIGVDVRANGVELHAVDLLYPLLVFFAADLAGHLLPAVRHFLVGFLFQMV